MQRLLGGNFDLFIGLIKCGTLLIIFLHFLFISFRTLSRAGKGRKDSKSTLEDRPVFLDLGDALLQSKLFNVLFIERTLTNSAIVREKTFGESVILTLNSFVIATTDRNIETFGLKAFGGDLTHTSSKVIDTGNLSCANLMLFGNRCSSLSPSIGSVNRGPLALADIN